MSRKAPPPRIHSYRGTEYPCSEMHCPHCERERLQTCEDANARYLAHLRGSALHDTWIIDQIVRHVLRTAGDPRIVDFANAARNSPLDPAAVALLGAGIQ